MFDWKKPTVQMLGRWQPWHEGHQALFKRCFAKTGQVIILVRDVQGTSGGRGQDDNPFDLAEVCKNIVTFCSDSSKLLCDTFLVALPIICSVLFKLNHGSSICTSLILNKLIPSEIAFVPIITLILFFV